MCVWPACLCLCASVAGACGPGVHLGRSVVWLGEVSVPSYQCRRRVPHTVSGGFSLTQRPGLTAGLPWRAAVTVVERCGGYISLRLCIRLPGDLQATLPPRRRASRGLHQHPQFRGQLGASASDLEAAQGHMAPASSLPLMSSLLSFCSSCVASIPATVQPNWKAI